MRSAALSPVFSRALWHLGTLKRVLTSFKELLRRALEIRIHNQVGMAKPTVNSSPNAVGAYQTMGFKIEGPEQTKNGIRFVPMALSSDLSL